jgi:hypothetical protein
MASNQHPPPTDPIETLARRFEFFAGVYRGTASEVSSPLYAQLARQVAADPDVLRLVTEADRFQQVSHLLFGAVHFLLLGGSAHPLAEFYPSLRAAPRPAEEAYPHFRAFCLEHAAEIRRLVTMQRVQTNEVQRCTALLPAFAVVSRWGGGKPLALVEAGASAGLNLLWDRYGYDYGAAGRAGDVASPVQLVCEVRGGILPPIPPVLPAVSYRLGIDLKPIDVRDEAATRWLRALIWPEHRDRARLLERAIGMARQDPPPMRAGDLLDLLLPALEEAPGDAAVCVYHSYTLNQCPRTTGEQLDLLLAGFSRNRDVDRISLEWFSGQQQPHLELYSYRRGAVQRTLLASCEAHGREIEWLQPYPPHPERP